LKSVLGKTAGEVRPGPAEGPLDGEKTESKCYRDGHKSYEQLFGQPSNRAKKLQLVA